MILTYKRKLSSLKSCSFYERLCGDPLAECSVVIKPVEDGSSNGCCSKETKEAKHKARPEDDLPNHSNPPIKFKYTRRPKSLCSHGSSLHYNTALQQVQKASQRLPEINFVQPHSDNIGCISCEDKLPTVDLNHDIRIPGQQSVPYGDSSSQKIYDVADKCLGPSENAVSFHHSCSRNQCIDIATNDAGQLNPGSSDIDRYSGGNFSSKVSDKKENEMGQNCSNISAKRGSELDCTCTSIANKPDSKDRDVTYGSVYQKCHRLETEWAEPLLTYFRRSRKDEDTRRIYVNVLAERSNFVVSEQNIRGSAGCHALNSVPKIIERSNSKAVLDSSALFSTSIEKLTDEISAVGGTISGQRNQKEGNSCQAIDDVDGSKIPSLNDEVATGHLPDDAIKPHHDICDLSLNTAYEKSSTEAAMQHTFKAALESSQSRSSSQSKAEVASREFSDKPGMMNCNAAASSKGEETLSSLQAKALKRSLERNLGSSVPAEARRAKGKELLEIAARGVTGTNGLPDINLLPSRDGAFISQNSKMVDSIALPNASTNYKLFPEDTSDSALQLNTSNSNSGLVPAVTSNNSSVTKAQPDLNVSVQESIQYKMFEPSSSQERQKLLVDSIRSWNGTPIGTSESTCQNFQAFPSYWSEEELDNLWVGVRRHGKNNWSGILRDPNLRFSPWRTESALAEKWILEQPKLLGNIPGLIPYYQYASPVGIVMPPLVTPGPGAMTRFLTDPTQLFLSNANLNNPGMFPPGPPTSPSTQGNGTRVLNRRVRAHNRSGNTWGRFRARNQVPSSIPLASSSGNDITPSSVGGTLDIPHSQPLLPTPPPLSAFK